MERMRIGVIRGGPTPAYDLSLKTGSAYLSSLSPERYDARDIFVDRTGAWHMRGRPVTVGRALSQLDGALIAIHGAYGEDGTLQRVLDTHGVRYPGADPFSAAVSLSKRVAKDRLSKLGVITPVFTIITEEFLDSPQAVVKLFREFPQPSIIKPLSGGSSIGVVVAEDFEQFDRGLRLALAFCPKVMIEEYIRGREATVGTMDGFRGEDVYALPPVEVAIDKGVGHFDYARKLTPKDPHRSPGTFSSDEKQELLRLAKLAHRDLSLRDLGRHDFVVAKRGIVYIESNSVPEVFIDSPFEVGLRAVGANISHAIDHLLGRVRSRDISHG